MVRTDAGLGTALYFSRSARGDKSLQSCGVPVGFFFSPVNGLGENEQSLC